MTSVFVRSKFLFCVLIGVAAVSLNCSARVLGEGSLTDSCNTTTGIGNVIDPLTGNPTLKKIDLVAKGAQSISLTRVYIPPYMPRFFSEYKHHQGEYDKKYLHEHLSKTYKGWQHFPHLRLYFDRANKRVRLRTPDGVALDFEVSRGKTTLMSPAYGISNFNGEEVSGKHDPRNTTITWEDNHAKIVVRSHDGTTRIYYKTGVVTASSHLYLLQREILPSGNILKYSYTSHRQLFRVESLDPHERHLYASLHLTGSPSAGGYRFVASSGASAEYLYDKRALEVKIKEKVKRGRYKEEAHLACPPLLASVSSPIHPQEELGYSERLLLNSYLGTHNSFACSYRAFGDPLHYRVHQLELPVGEKGKLEEVYKISYDPPVGGEKKGSTHVRRCDGTVVVYHFSKELLLTAVQYFGKEGSLQKEKMLTWDSSQRLSSIEIRDEQKQVLCRKNYSFDAFGNPILTEIQGDLTGKGQEETYRIRKKFSSDGRNLLLEEEEENGRVTTFSYLPDTELLTAKLIKERGKILERRFWVYDHSHQLIQSISDDGGGTEPTDLSGVSERTWVNYQLHQEGPCLHMPEWIEHKYLDQGVEKLLQRTHLVYDAQKNVTQEHLYDALGNLAYLVERLYNERGELLSETTPSGERIAYSYNSRGQCDVVSRLSHRASKRIEYDPCGRVIKEVERGGHQTLHATSYSYDPLGRCIQKIDPFQNSVHYTYDPVTSQVISTEFPSLVGANGEAVRVETKASFDPFSRKLTETDACGNTTQFRYNAYGAPIEILYPDGGRESFVYQKDGALAKHTDLSGMTTDYTRDIFGRVVSKRYTSSSGEPLGEESFRFKGGNLLNKIDSEGGLTQYFYDGAGRKIREKFDGKSTHFTYDTLGRLGAIYKENLDNTLQVHYERDSIGRVLEERNTDRIGNPLYHTSYSYGSCGLESVKRCRNKKETTEFFTYDPFGRIVEHIDSSGAVHTTLYYEEARTLLGQKVLQVHTTNSDGVTKIETYDPFGRVVKKEKIGEDQRLLSCLETFYDPQGNKKEERRHLYEYGEFLKTEATRYTYTSRNQKASVTVGYGTEEAQTTEYTYLPSGKVFQKTLPDGVTLSYAYDPWGAVRSIHSSDGQVNHVFQHDTLGRLLYASDENQQIALKRDLDAFGNVVEEEFSFGLKVEKKYDFFDRPLYLKVGTFGEIFYTYDPLFLRSAKKNFPAAKGPKENDSYYRYEEVSNLSFETRPEKDTAQYLDTDQNDEEAEAWGALDAGYSDATYDPLRRLIEVKSKKRKTTFVYDPLGRCLVKTHYKATSSGWKESDQEHFLYDGMHQIGSFHLQNPHSRVKQ